MGERSGRGAAGRAEGGQAGAPSSGPPDRQSRFCTKSSRDHPGLWKLPGEGGGSEPAMPLVAAGGAIWTEPTGRRSRGRAEQGVEPALWSQVADARWTRRRIPTSCPARVKPLTSVMPRVPSGAVLRSLPARSHPGSAKDVSRGYRGLPGDGARAGAGGVAGWSGLSSPSSLLSLGRCSGGGRSQAPDFSFIPSHSFLRPASDWLYLV